MNIYPWQQSQWQALIKQYQQNRLAHALLLQGRPGLGKLDFAYSVALMLLCCQPGINACGKCRSCELFKVGSHPDFYAMLPDEKGKSIKVDQVRDLTAALSQTSKLRGWQVAIIHPAELLNRAGSNALLKTLEEPMGQVCIILVANQQDSLPATIVSRCQRIYFTEPKFELARSWVKNELAINDEAAQLLLQLSGGAPLAAVAMSQAHYPEFRNQVLSALWQILQNEALVTAVASELIKHDVAVVLRVIFSIVMDIIRISSGLPQHVLENQDAIAELQKIKGKVNLQLLVQWMPQLLLAASRLQMVAGLNVSLLMEGVLLQWQKTRENYVG